MAHQRKGLCGQGSLSLRRRCEFALLRVRGGQGAEGPPLAAKRVGLGRSCATGCASAHSLSQGSVGRCLDARKSECLVVLWSRFLASSDACAQRRLIRQFGAGGACLGLREHPGRRPSCQPRWAAPHCLRQSWMRASARRTSVRRRLIYWTTVLPARTARTRRIEPVLSRRCHIAPQARM